MKLWTIQPLSALDEIEKTGAFRCREELSFNLSKPDSLKKQYEWLIQRMEQKIGPRPEGVDYPIWSWHTWDFERQCPEADSAAFLKRTEDKVLLTLEIPETDVVLTDFDAWQIVMQGGYLTTETDEDVLEELEERLFAMDDEAFHEAIVESWENVFDVEKRDIPDFQKGRYVQATFWEIRKEYILDTEILRKEEDA